MMRFTVDVERLDGHGSRARCKQASLILDTDPQGRDDAFNPAELLLAALAACIVKNVERVSTMIGFKFSDLHIRLDGTRQDSPPLMSEIEYLITIDTDEDDHRLELLHENIRRYGTVYNTIAAGARISGRLERKR